MAFSKNDSNILLSGILPSGDLRKKFDTFLKENGDSYDGNTYVFQKSDGTRCFVNIKGNTANLLIRASNGEAESVSQIFSALKPCKLPLKEREFLRGITLGKNGWETIFTGTMQNGRFLLNVTLSPDTLRALK